MAKIIFTFLLFFSCNCLASVPQDYTDFISALKQELIKKGASKSLVDKVYLQNFYKEKPAAIKADKQQSEFKLTTDQYLSKVINNAKIKKAKEKLKNNPKTLRNVYNKYGVQPEILVAFWGLESHFGQMKGNHYAFEVLTQLAYDKRRRTFFKNQLYYLFKIAEKYKLNPQKIKSSWAGAMGHFQFMPSTWYSYGKGDIVNSFFTSVHSAGNYLNKSGWQKNQTWGEETTLPANFNKKLIGRDKKKSIKELKKLGIKTNLADNLQASIITPDGENGKAYITLKNFDVIMKWNRSQSYAISVGTFADSIKSKTPAKK
ncbi:MAG: lytic murein transglycosylase [Alphaproteobacteria bacterium]